MKYKKGFLLAEETLKIIIALICIGFLVYFLVSLYMNNKENQELELAKATLEHLIDEKISGATEVEIYNPEDWYILEWPHETTSGWVWKETNVNVPLTCSNLGWNTCICICNGDTQKNCDENGICENELIEIEGKEIKIENTPMSLKINENKILK